MRFRPVLTALVLSGLLTSCDAVGDVIDELDPAPDLNLRIVNTSAPVPVGEHTLITIVASNDGEVEATEVAVIVVLPANIATINEPTGGDCSGLFCDAGEEIRIGLETLSPGESRMLSFPLYPDTPGVYTVNGTLNAVDADGVSGSTQVRAGIERRAFSGALTSPEGAVVPGQETTLSVTWANGTTSPVGDATLDLTVPSGFTVASAEGGGAIDGRRVRWSLGSVDVGEGGEFAVRVVIPETADFGDIDVAELTVSSDAGVSGTARRAFTITPATHVAIGVRADATSVPLDGQATVTLTLTNRSTNAETVGVRMTLPAGIRTIDEPSGADCSGIFCDAGEELRWGFDALPAGQTRTLSFPIAPEEGAQGPLVLGGWAQAENASAATSTTASLAITIDR